MHNILIDIQFIVEFSLSNSITSYLEPTFPILDFKK